MTKKEKRKYCSGCRNNFYNGNNDYGIQECWSLENAEVVKKKKVHINQIPPWKQKPIKTLDCYHQQDYIMVDPNKTH